MKNKNENKEKFSDKVYSIIMKVPKGKVITYKGLAELAGNPNAARAVGNIMKKNKHPEKIPCYKVVKSDGNIGGYSAKGGIKRKIELLRKEGIRIYRGKIDKRNIIY